MHLQEHITILETIVTTYQFEAKENTSSWPKVANSRKLDYWHNVEYYFNTDNDTVIMYVDGSPIAMKDDEGNFIEEFRSMRTKVDFVNLIRFTNGKKKTTFYIDDIEAGMYVPYSGISSETLTIEVDEEEDIELLNGKFHTMFEYLKNEF